MNRKALERSLNMIELSEQVEKNGYHRPVFTKVELEALKEAVKAQIAIRGQQ